MSLNDAPILMIGIQRSGSNLLRLMLNQIPEIAAPHPPHILQRMMPLASVYGDPVSDAAFALMVDDVCRLVELNPVAWDGVVLDRDDVASRCREKSLVAVNCAVYDVMAAAWGSQTWCCKSLANVYYLPELEAYLANARYLYLYRDGRDVALSFRKAVVGEKHFYPIAQEWKEVQELALTIRDQVPADRFFSLSYEALTTHPETSLRALCNFLGVTYNSSMLEFNQSVEATRTAVSSALWENVTKPVMSDNSRKFLTEASHEDLVIFESVAGHVLDALGYDRTTVPLGEERQFSEEEINRFQQINADLKKAVLAKTDPADLERRDRQAALLKEIKGRALVSS